MEGTTQDPRTMHPRELVRALMRGDAASFKAGYSAPNAAIAACEIQDIHGQDRADLHEYAQGFADGMQEDRERISPA